MQKLRFAVALIAVSALFAGYLHADRITFYKQSGSQVSAEVLDQVTITEWSAAEVKYRTADNKTGTVSHSDLISLDRMYGSQSQALTSALQQLGADTASALDGLEQVAENGSNLDKEEARFMIAELLYNEAAAGSDARINRAIQAYQNYTGSYPKGYFARDAYRRLAELQQRAGRVGDARSTLSSMAKADASLRTRGSQLLGELEAGQGRWKQAISAFKDAKSGAKGEKNKNAEYLAQAWEGLCTLKDGNTAAAKALLEPITKDNNFDDPNSIDDEVALGVAYRALGDVHLDTEAWEVAYDAYVKGAYYSWWTQGRNEGYCLAQGYLCAKKLEGTGEKWKNRRSKLRSALALGYPRELQRVENE